MTNILGISAFYHDSAACLLQNGEIIAAAQEERFTRKKHDSAFPENAINYCLNQAQLNFQDIDIVVFYDKPILKFDRILETYFSYAPKGLRSFLKAIPIWLKEKLFISKKIGKFFGKDFTAKILYIHHHESHAASSFYPSPFDEAAIVTVDGVGEWTTTAIGAGKQNKITLLQEIKFPHSLGLLYSAFTYYIGFKVNSGEYKLMGLAPYGEPKYVNLIKENLIDIKEDGSFWMNMSYFNYCQGLTMTSKKFHKLFDGPPRSPEGKLNQKHMDIASSIQKVTEEVMLKIINHAHKITGSKNLCLAGGVALNCVANGKILREGPFDKIFIQPASGDAGGALGAALFGWYHYLEKFRTADNTHDNQKGSLLGPAFSHKEIESFLDSVGAQYTYYENEDELLDLLSDYIIDENVIGFFQGRMEFGPRALGARSILGDARSTNMQSIMNLKIKFRESFRPFAPCILEEKVSDYFEIDTPSPYMLRVANVQKNKRHEMTEEQKRLFGIDKLNIKRSVVPAITHVDYSARIQTADLERNPRYYKLIKSFYKKTNCPILVNTSFNIRGEPIVCKPEDAYKCFMFTNIDVLILENYVLLKKDQSELDGAEDYKKQFELD